jgi:hypothetical protein
MTRGIRTPHQHHGVDTENEDELNNETAASKMMQMLKSTAGWLNLKSKDKKKLHKLKKLEAASKRDSFFHQNKYKFKTFGDLMVDVDGKDGNGAELTPEEQALLKKYKSTLVTKRWWNWNYGPYDYAEGKTDLTTYRPNWIVNALDRMGGDNFGEVTDLAPEHLPRTVMGVVVNMFIRFFILFCAI